MPKKKEDLRVVFESWLKTCTDEQRTAISEVDTHLGEIQTDKKNLRREMQPLSRRDDTGRTTVWNGRALR